MTIIPHQQQLSVPVNPRSASRPIAHMNGKSARSICAVMVTYHPCGRTLENVAMILLQVQNLVIVDNGSDTGEVVSLRASSETSGFQLIENHENIGIAEALNQGIAWAKSRGYEWVILFDQNNTMTSGFID